MPDGGTVTIETANVEGDGGEGDFVSIAVRDTGHGMSEDVAARALEPFFTTKAMGKGTGLGLSQVYGFVTQSGGALDLASTPGEGTSVALLLPRDRSAGATSHEPDDAGATVPGGRSDETILVAEDEEQVRQIAVETLRELGYGVVEAESGEEALAVLQDRPDVALLFTDIVMPGMEGRRLAALARQQRPKLPILYTTGYAPDGPLDRPGSGDDALILRKPFESAQLARAVRHALDA
jgi:CheY-like chemotaxis protein